MVIRCWLICKCLILYVIAKKLSSPRESSMRFVPWLLWRNRGTSFCNSIIKTKTPANIIIFLQNITISISFTIFNKKFRSIKQIYRIWGLFPLPEPTFVVKAGSFLNGIINVLECYNLKYFYVFK